MILAPESGLRSESHACPMREPNDSNYFTVPTVSGERVNILEPRAEMIRILDIATGLANTCRYAGQIQQFYSVAQHSVIVSRIVPERLAPYGLLHDAAEAYMHDLGPAIKLMVGAVYRPVEDRLQDVIYQCFGLHPLGKEDKLLVKHADGEAALAEMSRFGIAGRSGNRMALASADPVVALDPVKARVGFLDRFSELFQ